MILTGREPHPLMPCLTAEEEARFGPEKVAEFYELRKQALITAEQDQFRYGYEPPIWKKADEATAALRKKFPLGVITELDLGGNRASKTERRAKRLVQNMVNNPGWRAWALQSTQTSSRQNQQSVIYKYLPPEWKPATGKLRGGVTTKIVYSQAGGFTEDVLVCPNGSECRFKFYSMDVGSVEGAELDEAWPDELVTPDWIEALTFRLVTRNGLLGITFTPVEGYTQTVKQYLAGAVTKEEVDAELLPIRDAQQNVIGLEKVPRLQENDTQRATILYFHTADNPFGNYEGMKETLKGKPRETILMRAYGVPTKSANNAFPLFNDKVHVITWERFLQVVKGGGCRYHIVDPCSGRNWFMIWVLIDPLNRKFIYREWPSHGHPQAYIPGMGEPGPWAVPGKPLDGEPGPGQREFGWGIAPYLEEIERLETNERGEREEIIERWMDGRYGNARTIGAEENTTLIQEIEKQGVYFKASKGEQQIFSDRNSGSIRLITDALYYDTSKPITALNQPHLYIVETCPNTIYAMKEWTGQDGLKGACKDPVDTVRMLELCDLEYVDEGMLSVRRA